MNTNMLKNRSLLNFFLLEFVLSVPFWALSAVTNNVEVFPGLRWGMLWAFTPMIASLILVFRENKGTGVIELLKRTYDFRLIKSKIWYLPIFLVYPSFVFVEYWILRLSGAPIPPPHFSVVIPLFYIMNFFAAYGEELGWTGYAIDPMQERWSALKSGILLGIAWAGFHIPLFFFDGYSFYWIFWHSLYVVAGRVLLVWVYNNTGKSMFAMSLFHASFGLYWYLWPIVKWTPTFYDPRIVAFNAILYVTIVTLLWGPKTLAQYRFARSGGRMSREEQKRATA